MSEMTPADHAAAIQAGLGPCKTTCKLDGSPCPRHYALAALAALVAQAETARAPEGVAPAAWAASNHIIRERAERTEAAEAQAETAREALRDAAEGEEHLTVRARSDNNVASARMHSYAAGLLRALLAGGDSR